MCLAPILVLNRSHPLPSGGGVRVTPPPSGDRWLRPGSENRLLLNRSHPLPSGGAVRVTPPPSGDRWLRLGADASKSAIRSSCAWHQILVPNRSHPLPSDGAARVTPPPSGDRWLPRGRMLAKVREARKHTEAYNTPRTELPLGVSSKYRAR
jgi:hypothetical protein